MLAAIAAGMGNVKCTIAVVSMGGVLGANGTAAIAKIPSVRSRGVGSRASGVPEFVSTWLGSALNKSNAVISCHQIV